VGNCEAGDRSMLVGVSLAGVGVGLDAWSLQDSRPAGAAMASLGPRCKQMEMVFAWPAVLLSRVSGFLAVLEVK
jgi:hypothetical protein